MIPIRWHRVPMLFLITMRILPTLLLFACNIRSIDADAADDVDGKHPSRESPPSEARVWAFSYNGIQIYSANGQTLLKTLPSKEICQLVDPHDDDGEEASDCFFFDGVADREHVWVSSPSRPNESVFVFEQGTMELLYRFSPTCGTPMRWGYDSVREELSLRCAGAPSNVVGELHVFSSILNENETISSKGFISLFPDDSNRKRAYGHHVMDASLGDIGYATINVNYICMKLIGIRNK